MLFLQVGKDAEWYPASDINATIRKNFDGKVASFGCQDGNKGVECENAYFTRIFFVKRIIDYDW